MGEFIGLVWVVSKARTGDLIGQADVGLVIDSAFLRFMVGLFWFWLGDGDFLVGLVQYFMWPKAEYK